MKARKKGTTEKSDIVFANICTYIGENCPELNDSEDERIRKSLIKHFREYESCTFDGLTSTKVLAWLERQDKGTNWKPSKEEMDVLYGLAYITNQYDEHKEEVITRLYQDLKREFFNGSSYENMFPTNTSTEDDVRRRSTIQVLEYARSLDNYNQYGKADIDKNISWLEKQGNKDKFIKEEIECIKGYLENAIKKLEELEKQGEHSKIEALRTEYEKGRADTLSEMKSSWSEEDEGYIDTLIGIMNERMNCSDEGTMVYNTYKKTQDWLKSLKQRIGG